MFARTWGFDSLQPHRHLARHGAVSVRSRAPPTSGRRGSRRPPRRPRAAPGPRSRPPSGEIPSGTRRSSSLSAHPSAIAGRRLGVELQAEVRTEPEGGGAGGRAGELLSAGRQGELVVVEVEPRPRRDLVGIVGLDLEPADLGRVGGADRAPAAAARAWPPKQRPRTGTSASRARRRNRPPRRPSRARPCAPGVWSEPSEQIQGRSRGSAGKPVLPDAADLVGDPAALAPVGEQRRRARRPRAGGSGPRSASASFDAFRPEARVRSRQAQIDRPAERAPRPAATDRRRSRRARSRRPAAMSAW